MFCGECGTRNPDTNQFCSNCGKPLGKRQAASLAQPAPVSSPAAAPAPAPAVPVMQPSPIAVPAPAAVPNAAPKRRRNWLGFLSLIFGILSFVILTGILALGAILLGIISLVWFRKATGRIGISSIVGIILGIVAISLMVALA